MFDSTHRVNQRTPLLERLDICAVFIVPIEVGSVDVRVPSAMPSRQSAAAQI